MPKLWRAALERAEESSRKREEYERTHPPINRLTKLEADSTRKFTLIGEKIVKCDLPCYGNYVARQYTNSRNIVDIREVGINLPSLGCYYAPICSQKEGRVCVTVDERLRRAIER